MALVRALTSGVSGLRNFQTAIDVIGDNISNVNTNGFKSARTTFQDAITQTLRFASPPGATTGGVNPSQVGLGSLTSSIDLDISQGTFQNTGRNTDMAVDGSGFFVVQTNQGQRFTRDGNFRLNANNILTTAKGDFVQGFQADSTGAITNVNTPGNISIPVGTQTIARATTSVTYGGNINASTAFPAVGFVTPPVPAGVANVPTTVRVFDSLGNGHDLRVTFVREAVVAGNTRVHFFIENANPADTSFTFAAGFGRDDGVGPNTNAFITSAAATPSGEIEFNTSGTPVAVRTNLGVVAANTYTLTLNYTNGAASGQAAVFDMSRMTQLSGASSAAAQNQNGVQAGTLFNFTVGLNGIITGLFTNGLQQTIAQVAMANFVNPSGLNRNGSDLFEQTSNSGIAQIGTPTTGGRGSVVGGSLESSNVDLSDEFTKLIVAQRAFQANSRIITVSDDVLTELVNIVRR